MRCCIGMVALVIVVTANVTCAAPIELYSGGGHPLTEGWETGAFSGADLGTFGTSTTGSETIFSTTQTAVQRFQYDVAANNYIASIRLQVDSAEWNPLDAGLSFSPFGAESFVAADRTNSVAFRTDKIHWQDSDADAHLIDTTVYHEYAISYIGGDIHVYVDTPFADILTGTATPVLSRPDTGPSREFYSVGKLVFGDGTNDTNSGPYVNSVYTVDYVMYQELVPGDFDFDDDFDGIDFLALQRGYGTKSGAARTEGDADYNGAVNDADVTLWEQHFGMVINPLAAEVSPVSAVIVTEPTTCGLAMIATLCLVVGRQRS